MKLNDVIITATYDTDQATGLQASFKWLEIWADTGALEAIKAVKGVHSVLDMGGNRYLTWLDPRYDRSVIIAEIEAAIKINVQPQD